MLSYVAGVGLLVVDPVDHRTTTVTVDLDHRVDVWPDRYRGSTSAPLQRNRAVGEFRSLGDDPDTADSGRVLVTHQDESPDHLVVSGANAPPGRTSKPSCSSTVSAGIPVYPLSNGPAHAAWRVVSTA